MLINKGNWEGWGSMWKPSVLPALFFSEPKNGLKNKVNKYLKYQWLPEIQRGDDCIVGEQGIC